MRELSRNPIKAIMEGLIIEAYREMTACDTNPYTWVRREVGEGLGITGVVVPSARAPIPGPLEVIRGIFS